MDLDEDWRSEYTIRDSYPGRVTYRSELPAPETRISIHPSGLLQWQAEEFDRVAVQSVRRVTPNCGDCDVTCEDCNEEFERRTACGWEAGRMIHSFHERCGAGRMGVDLVSAGNGRGTGAHVAGR